MQERMDMDLGGKLALGIAVLALELLQFYGCVIEEDINFSFLSIGPVFPFYFLSLVSDPITSRRRSSLIAGEKIITIESLSPAQLSR
jgi:hypothetical protein